MIEVCRHKDMFDIQKVSYWSNSDMNLLLSQKFCSELLSDYCSLFGVDRKTLFSKVKQLISSSG